MKTYPVVDWCGLVCVFLGQGSATDDSVESPIDSKKEKNEAAKDFSGDRQLNSLNLFVIQNCNE